MKNIQNNIFLLFIYLILSSYCGPGSSQEGYRIKRNLREKYKEEFIILTEKASLRYQGRNTEESCLKIISFESPDYANYQYTVCPETNRKLVFYAWYHPNNISGTISDNYYDANLEYQVKEYVYGIISAENIPKKFINCYVTIHSTQRLLLYEKHFLNIYNIIKIEDKLPEKALTISINFDLRTFSEIKNEYKEAAIKLWSVLIKTDWKNYTRIHIAYNYNKEYKNYDSINISLSQIKSENEIRNYIDRKIKLWKRINKKYKNE